MSNESDPREKPQATTSIPPATPRIPPPVPPRPLATTALRTSVSAPPPPVKLPAIPGTPSTPPPVPRVPSLAPPVPAPARSVVPPAPIAPASATSEVALEVESDDAEGWDEFCQDSADEAAQLAPAQPTRAALLLAVASGVAGEALRDDKRAAQLLAQAAGYDPGGRAVLAAVRAQAERVSPPGLVLEAVVRELAAAGAVRERVALLWQSAALQRYALGDAGRARESLSELLALDPQDVGAWLTQGWLDWTEKRHEQAVEAWLRAAALCDDPKWRASLLAGCAAVQDGSLGRGTEALQTLERALECDGSCALALALLESLALRTGDHARYVRALVALADDCDDPAALHAQLERAGDVAWDALHDAELAARCFKRALATEPTANATAEKLAAALGSMGRHAEQAAVLEALVARTEAPSSLLHRLGLLYEASLAQPEQAVATYRRALELDAGFEPARESLAQLYRSLERWDALIALELDALERTADTAERAAELAAVAAHAEARDQKPARARRLFARAFELDARAPGAFAALERIHREAQDWPALAALYDAALRATTDPLRKRALAHEHGALLHERLGQPGEAARVLRSALDQGPDTLGPLLRLARALHDARRWPELVEALAAQLAMLTDGAEIEAHLLQLALVQEAQLGDLTAALATCARLLARSPKHRVGLHTRVRLLAALGRWTDVVATEREALEAQRDPLRAAGVLHRLGGILESRLGRPDEALACWRAAVERAPAHAPSRHALEHALRQRGEPARLAELLEADARNASESAAKARALCDAARVRELACKDLSAARALYASALAAQPGNVSAAWGHARLCDALGDWRALRTSGDELLGSLGGARARRHWLLGLAVVEELRLDNPRGALELQQRALDAGEPVASLFFERARVSFGVGGPAGLEAWLERAAATTVPPEFALHLHRLLGLAAEYGRPEGALAASRAYRVAIEQSPTDVQAHDGLARCLARLGRFDGLPAVRWARAHLTEDHGLRVWLLLAAATRSIELERAAEAEAACTAALPLEPELFAVHAMQRRACATAADERGVAEASARAGEVATKPELGARLLLEAARAFDKKLAQPDRALRALRIVLSRQPAHSEALSRALALLEAQRDGTSQVILLRAAVLASEGTEAQRGLLVQRAHVLAERLDDVPGAIAELVRARALAPPEPSLLATLARCYVRDSRWHEAIEALTALEQASQDPAERRRAALERGALWLERVRDAVPARELFATLVARDATDREAARGLLRACTLQGDTHRALEMLRKLAQSGPEDERFSDTLALVELEYGPAGSRAERPVVLGELAALSARDPARVPLAEALVAKLNAWDAFVQSAERELTEGLPRGPGLDALRTLLARVCEQVLQRPEAAEAHLRALLESTPDALEPQLSLASLRAGRDDDGALAALRRAVELAPYDARAWRGLFALAQRQGLSGPTILAASTLTVLGEGSAATEAALATPVPPKPLTGSLTAAEVQNRFLGKTLDPFSRKVLERIGPFLPQLFPAGQAALEATTLLPEVMPPAQWTRAVADALGLGSLAVGRSPARDAMLLLSDPPAVLLTSELAREDALTSLLCWAGYTLGRAAVGAPALAALGPEQCVALVECALGVAHEPPGYRELKRRIASVLPRKTRKELERLVLEEGSGVDVPRDVAAWDEGVRACATRLCILFSRDLRVVLPGLAYGLSAAGTHDERRAVLDASPAALDALRFASSELCWATGRVLYGVA